MSNLVKGALRAGIKKVFNVGIEDSGIKRDLEFHSKNNLVSQVEQKNLFLNYKKLLFDKKFLPSIKDVGFRVFSQNDEDGILLYIFSLIGMTNKLCLDISFASPIGANTTNLICNLDWTGLLVCGDAGEQKKSIDFFRKHPDTHIHPPKVVQKWITAENINDFLLNCGLSGEIDLFSLDMDGVDYWIWKSLDVVSPRVIVVEFQGILGFDKSVTIPYKSDFSRSKEYEDFLGASLAAFVKLADSKGYRLVGCNKYCFNAFFIKEELAQDVLPTLSAEECFLLHPIPEWIKKEREIRFKKIENLPWVNV